MKIFCLIKIPKYLLTSLVLGVYFGCLNLSFAQDPRPNVILIVVDDLGWADVGCNGSRYYETPNIDQLAHEGIFFSNALTTSLDGSFSRISILTGKYPGLLNDDEAGNSLLSVKNELPIRELTLAEALKKHGYQTWHLGDWLEGCSLSDMPENQGFDLALPTRDGPKSTWVQNQEPEVLVDNAIDLLNQKEEGPFFLNLWFSNQVATSKDNKKLRYFKKKSRSNWMGFSSKDIYCSDFLMNLFLDNNANIQKTNTDPLYAVYLSDLDDNIGRLLHYLNSKCLTDNTIIIFTSDNGGKCGHAKATNCNFPLRGGKGELFEGGIRVPFIIDVPGIHRHGQRCDQPVLGTDIYPTILELAQLPKEPHQHLDGLSLAEVLDYKCEVKRDAIYWRAPHQGGTVYSAIRCHDWKLIIQHENGAEMLFHLVKDIGETNNLIQKFPLKATVMKQKLAKWLGTVNP